MASTDNAINDAPISGRILITGGTGFVGSAIQSALAGRPLRLLVRNPAKHAHQATDLVEVVEGDVTDAESLRRTMDDCEAVIHLVAIIDERGGATFDKVIRQGSVNVIDEAQRAGVTRLLHMSALGAIHDPKFAYFEAKWQAEQAVQRSPLAWTIFRPSIIFGPGDGFITVLANLVSAAPLVPVVGSGESTFQPIRVNEVAASYARALDDPKTIGQIYELGGGQIYTYEEMIDLLKVKLGKRGPNIHIPVPLMKLVVSMSQPLPEKLRPPVTSEQLKMLAVNNSTASSATSSLIGHEPTRLEDALDYITRR
ncbi:MAG: complex I NDUFA9 subunit family protein [Chloroflexia bacterium]|jgi:NADH dehydrogenase|nr:complex I NDUFA9 subunit family protein [Chloroflexia bacterium]